MGLLDLQSRIALTESIAHSTLTAAWVLLAALGVMAGCFAFIRAMVAGESRAPLAWVVQLLFVTGVLAAYNQIFDAILEGSQGLSEHFADQAGWSQYWSTATA